MEKRGLGAGLMLLSLLQIALAVGSMRNDSATADEGAHIAPGWMKLVYGRLDFYREQQPLMNALTALPLYVAGYSFPLPSLDEANHWAVGSEYLFRSGYESQRILMLARLPAIALLAALPWVGYAFVSRQSGNRRWAVAAFVLIAFCPNLLAHGRLATVDIGATFFCFASAVLLVRVIERPRIATGAAFGVVAAAAILSKTSALIIIPYAALVATIGVVCCTPDRKKVLAALGTAVVTAFGVAELVIAGMASDAYVARQFPELGTGLERLALPFREISTNVRLIREWYDGSHFKLQYLLGTFSQNSWWYYYPVALFLKMTLPSLGVSIAALALLLLRRRATFGAVAALLFAAMFLAAAMAGDLALGVRYVLPILPFLYTAAAIVLSRTAGAKTAAAVAVLVACHLVEPVRS